MKYYQTFIFSIIFSIFLICWDCKLIFAEPDNYTNKLGMKFILIPSGNFIMGSLVEPKVMGNKWEALNLKKGDSGMKNSIKL